MIICAHRINTIEGLKALPEQYGVEIDIRGHGDKLLLNHYPIDDPEKYDELEEYLKHFKHRFLIFNVKEAGYEQRIMDLAKKYGIEDYFLLDVEYPFIYRAVREGVKRIAVRYSEAEALEFTLAHREQVDWVWVDTNTKLPLDPEIAEQLKGFKLALVAPDRWGRPEDNVRYRKYMEENNIKIDMVMTEKARIGDWE